MKILFFIDSLTAGGKERRFSELLKGLNLLPDISFEIVVMDDDIHYGHIFELNTNIHYLIRRTKKDISVFLKFYKICARYQPDIVHTWDDMTSVIAVPACLLLNIKLVNGMVVDTPVKRNISNKYWLRAKLTFPFSNKIIGNSEAGLIAYNAPSNKKVRIYNGMDLDRFEGLKDPAFLLKEFIPESGPDAFIIGMVAAFEDRKDYSTLIESAISLLDWNPAIHFILVGDGTNMQKIRRQIPKELQAKVIFLGRRSDVEAVVNFFDVGVLLTQSKVHGEGISNSIIEYMAMGKPVIATRGGGTDEVVVDKVNGFLIDPSNSEQLVKTIQMLYNDRDLCVKLGEAGRRRVEKLFDLKIMIQNYVMVYKNVLKVSKN